jgi:uncharacterized iron-regulated protein
MKLRFLFCLALSLASSAQDKKAVTDQNYRVFRGDGSPATVADIVASAKDAQVVFLGETHDDPVAHHLEAELWKQLVGPESMLSLEMFETDVQAVVDEYLNGQITEEHLLSSGRAWRNYKADYRPLLELAKERKIRVIAANAPRRYVNRVGRMGKGSLDSLTGEAKRFLPPLPYAEASPEYAEKFNTFMEELKKEAAKRTPPPDPAKSAEAKAPPDPPRDPRWQLEAQSLWDASMAFSIAEALLRSPSARIVHVNGSFHTEKRLGILDHLSRYRPNTRSLVVTMRADKSFPNWNSEKLANVGDFVILTDPSLSQPQKALEAPRPEPRAAMPVTGQ